MSSDTSIMISIAKRSECQPGRKGISFITTGKGLKIGPGDVNEDYDLERRHRRPDRLDHELIHSLKRYRCGVRSLTEKWRRTTFGRQVA